VGRRGLRRAQQTEKQTSHDSRNIWDIYWIGISHIRNSSYSSTSLSSILLSSGALTRFFVDRHNLFRMGTDNALLSLALGSVPTVNEEEVMQQLLRAAWMSWGGKWP